MKQNLVIGWPNADGSGKPVVFGPPTSEKEKQELGRLINDAKKLHRFPKGIKFLAYGEFDSTEVAIFISEATAETLQEEDKARRQRQKFAAQLEAAEAAVPAARQNIAAARKGLGRATENLNRATKRHATEAADDARFEALLKNAASPEDKDRLQKSLEAERAQTAAAKAALEQAQEEHTAATKALAAAEAALPEAIKKLEELKTKA